MAKQRKQKRGRGEGWIERRVSSSGKVSYRAGVTVGWDANAGKQLKLTETFATERGAGAWRNEQLAAKQKGELAIPGKLTLGEWLDRWLLEKQDQNEPGTIEFYRGHCATLKKYLGPIRLDSLTAERVQSAFNRMTKDELAVDRRRKTVVTLRTALDAAVDLQLIPRNPARKVGRVKKPRRRPDIRP